MEGVYPRDLALRLKAVADREVREAAADIDGERYEVTLIIACIGAVLAWMCDSDDDAMYGAALDAIGRRLQGYAKEAANPTCPGPPGGGALCSKEIARALRHAIAHGNCRTHNPGGKIRVIDFWNDYKNARRHMALRLRSDVLGELFKLVNEEFVRVNESVPRDPSAHLETAFTALGPIE